MKKRIPGLDGLRAVSIVWVLMSHLVTLPYFPKWHWFYEISVRGQLGVDIFFVLSGFLITWLMLDEESRNGHIDLKQFYIRRAYRILPPALTYLAFVIVLVNLRISDSGWFDITAAACFFRNFSGKGHFDTAHFWSLAIEEQFYLTWPFLLVLIRRRWRVAAVIGLLFASVVWRHEYYRLFTNPRVGIFEFHYDGLLIGCLLALMQQTTANEYLIGRTMRSGWFATGVVGVFAFLASSIAEHFPGKLLAVLPVMHAICIALLINYLIQPRKTVTQRILDLPPVAWLGRLSYSLYLWQEPFCFKPSSLSCPFPLNIALGMTGAVFSYYCVEQPALRLRKQRRVIAEALPARQSSYVSV